MKSLFLLITVALSSAFAAEFQVRQLENGLTVIVSPDHISPVVTICIAVKTGATCETPETNGLAHFYEHMFFKGNEALPDQTAYNRRLGELGILQNGTTYPERVQYFITLGSDEFENGMTFMFDAITSPLFDMEEMEREREVIMNEYQRGLSSPFYNLTMANQEVLFSDAPWRISAIGVPEVIEAAAPPAMHDFQHIYYTPDNSALIIAGDVDYDEAFRLAEEQFSGWEYGGRSNYDSLSMSISIDRDTTVYVDSPTGAGYISVVFEGPSISTDPGDSYPADVWGSYLALMSREFFTDLVTNGPFINIYGSYYTQRFGPSITFAGLIPPDRAEEGLALLLDEIDQLQDIDYYDQEGIQLAKDELHRHRILAEETSYDVAVESIPFWWVVAGSLEYYETYLDSLSAVGMEDIEAFLDEWLTGRPRAAFVMMPLEGEGGR
ncbi:MAG: insulinase family protein [Candidatus Fermentibacteraceae bacterium]|nr:insulinase family protein [Candidatus Fermentibacteraceae bacterium]MBN2609350.1 insulinase family protein [Candidatus Fermentibacteraceae bacterium]